MPSNMAPLDWLRDKVVGTAFVVGTWAALSGAALLALGIEAPRAQTPVIGGHSVPINISTATTTQLVGAIPGQAIYVAGWNVVAGGPGIITLEYGTGTNCGTGTTAITGPYGWTAQTGIATTAPLFVPPGNALCAVTSAAVQMSGYVSYSQH